MYVAEMTGIVARYAGCYNLCGYLSLRSGVDRVGRESLVVIAVNRGGEYRFEATQASVHLFSSFAVRIFLIRAGRVNKYQKKPEIRSRICGINVNQVVDTSKTQSVFSNEGINCCRHP